MTARSDIENLAGMFAVPCVSEEDLNRRTCPGPSRRPCRPGAARTRPPTWTPQRHRRAALSNPDTCHRPLTARSSSGTLATLLVGGTLAIRPKQAFDQRCGRLLFVEALRCRGRPLRREMAASGGISSDIKSLALHARQTLKDDFVLLGAPDVRDSRPSFRGCLAPPRTWIQARRSR